MNIRKTISVGLIIVLLLGISINVIGTGNHKETLELTLTVETPTIPSVVTVNNSIIENAIIRAEYLISQAQSTKSGNKDVQRFLQSATKKLEISKSESDPWKALINAREASIEAVTVVAYAQANEGRLSEKDILNEIPKWENKILLLETRLEYRGADLERSLIVAAEVERSLNSANNWLNQAQEIINLTNRPRELRIAYAMGALEAVYGNLEDAEFLLNLIKKDEPNQEDAIVRVYTKFSKEVMLELENREYPQESFANLTLNEAIGVIKRADSKFNNGLKASAAIDLIHAFILLQSLDALSEVPDPWYFNATITANDVYRAKKQAVQALEEAIKNANGNELSLYLLKFAESEIHMGDSLVQRSIDHEKFENTESLRLAYALYIRAANYAKNVHRALMLLQD